MALSPDDKKIYLNRDTTAGEADVAMYCPVKYLTGLESTTNTTATLYFRGPNNTTSTSITVLITTDYIKEFYTQFVNEINFGDKAVITLAVKNLSVSTTQGGSDFVYVNAYVGAAVANDDSAGYEDLQIAEDLDVGGTITGDLTGDVTGNADTATALATARAINGVDFDGTGAITVTAAGSTLSDTVTVAKGGTGLTTVAANTILTGNGTSALTAETDLTYDGSELNVVGDVIVDGDITANSFDGLWDGGAITVAKGGTGLTTVAVNTILTGNGTSALTAETNLTFSANRLHIGADDEITPQVRFQNDENTVTLGISDTADNLVVGSADGDFVISNSGDHNVLITQNNEIALTVDTNGDSNFNRRFTVTGDTDGTYEGDVVYFGGTTSMTAGTIYHYKSDGTWEAANANAVATSDGLLGVALGAASDTNGMLLRGMVTLDHDPGAVGDVLFLSNTEGDASATAPSDNNDIVRVIGYCLHASNGQIWFNPDGTYVEVTA